MMIVILILIAVMAFLIGFLLGIMREPEIKLKKVIKSSCDTETLRKEYENFLNYDGTEQS